MYGGGAAEAAEEIAGGRRGVEDVEADGAEEAAVAEENAGGAEAAEGGAVSDVVDGPRVGGGAGVAVAAAAGGCG